MVLTMCSHNCRHTRLLLLLLLETACCLTENPFPVSQDKETVEV
jgi:hypothetical protein